MKPRASAPRITSGLRGRAHSASWSIDSAKTPRVGDQRHQVLEDDPLASGSRGRHGSGRGGRALTGRATTPQVARAAAAARAPAPRRQRLEIVERRLAPLRVARAKARRDELLEQRRLPAGGGAEGAQVARVDPVARDAGAARRRCRPRSRGRGGRRPRAGLDEVVLLQLAREVGRDAARSHSSARSISSSRSAEATCTRRVRSAALGASSASRITRSGRNSSRCSRRIVVEPLDVAPARTAGSRRASAAGDEALILEVADLRDGDVRELVSQALAHGSRSCGGALGGLVPRLGGARSSLQERQSVLADLDLVVVLERRPTRSGGGSRTCRSGCRGRGSGSASPSRIELGMPAGDGDVVEEDVALGRAPDQRPLRRAARRSVPPFRRRSARRAPGP